MRGRSRLREEVPPSRSGLEAAENAAEAGTRPNLSALACASQRGPIVMRLMAILLFAALIAGCSGSSRVEDVVPAWANTPPPHSATQHAARRNQPENRGTIAAEQKPPAQAQSEARKPAAASEQPAKKPDTQTASEE
jgi:hypothetical protein